MFAGYAFAIDSRDRRGHAYMLSDQEATKHHDFILSQGLLPPDILARTVQAEFLDKEKAAPVVSDRR